MTNKAIEDGQLGFIVLDIIYRELLELQVFVFHKVGSHDEKSPFFVLERASYLIRNTMIKEPTGAQKDALCRRSSGPQ